MTRRPWRSLLQTGAFVRKEIVDVVHQPRLLASLVVAPFVILLAFGAGYRAEVEPYRAWLVDPTGHQFADRVRESADQLGRFIRIVGDGTDEADARRRLADGHIDVVVVFPADPLATVTAGKQAPITILHNRIDPIEQTAIDFASRLAVDVVNGRILAAVVTTGQESAAPLGRPFEAADGSLQAADQALGRGDRDEARSQVDALTTQLDGLRAILRLRSSLDGQVGADGSSAAAVPADDAFGAADQALADADRDLAAARTGLDARDDAATRQSLAALSGRLRTVDDRWSTLATVDADVLVRPFVTRLENVTPGRRNLSDFYVPAAVMLLVQQFGVAFGALSFVREKALGIVDVFRIAPVGAAETVTGKYLGYTAVGGVVAAALVALVRFVLRVPMAGAWGDTALVVGLTLVASVGLGLLISLVASTDTQAVQYTMITLLASLFFSGFFLSVDQLTYPIRSLSWLLPSTYGSRLLRDVMLRGLRPDRTMLGALAGHVAAGFVLTVLGARRRLAGDT